MDKDRSEALINLICSIFPLAMIVALMIMMMFQFITDVQISKGLNNYSTVTVFMPDSSTQTYNFDKIIKHSNSYEVIIDGKQYIFSAAKCILN